MIIKIQKVMFYNKKWDMILINVFHFHMLKIFLNNVFFFPFPGELFLLVDYFVSVSYSSTSRAEFPSAKAVMDGFGGADLTISKLRQKTRD